MEKEKRLPRAPDSKPTRTSDQRVRTNLICSLNCLAGMQTAISNELTLHGHSHLVETMPLCHHGGMRHRGGHAVVTFVEQSPCLGAALVQSGKRRFRWVAEDWDRE